MGLFSESIRYMNLGYFNDPDHLNENYQLLEKGLLYFSWGIQSHERNDFHQAFQHLTQVKDEFISEIQVLDRHIKLLSASLNILQFELKEVVDVFDFLNQNKLRIELRDLNFKKQIDDKINSFTEIEEECQKNILDITRSFNEYNFNETHMQKRIDFLVNFETDHNQINEGIQAFYIRIKEFIGKEQVKENSKT